MSPVSKELVVAGLQLTLPDLKGKRPNIRKMQPTQSFKLVDTYKIASLDKKC